MKQKIKFFTNEVYPAWEPTDIDNFLGGSEELIVLLAQALVANNYDVEVYHSARIQSQKEYNGVQYLPREQAQCNEDDIFITFKDNQPWINGAKSKLNIHLTADIESGWGVDKNGQLHIDNLDAFVNISNYQRRKNFFVPYEKEYAFPLGVDIDSLEKNKQEQIDGTLLYCSSPDRGLLQLLNDWPTIKQKHPNLKLKVAYGWRHFNFQNLQLRNFRNHIQKLMDQHADIEYLGMLSKDEIEREYWKAQYWILPLNNPDSELFCLNAVKSKYCGCTPVVNKLGALSETVGDYIPYLNFIKGNMSIVQEKGAFSKAISWDEVVKKYWIPKILSKVK